MNVKHLRGKKYILWRKRGIGEKNDIFGEKVGFDGKKTFLAKKCHVNFVIDCIYIGQNRYFLETMPLNIGL